MPTPKQMEKLAAEAARRPGPSAAAPDASLPAEYWESVLKDPRADATRVQLRQRRLSEVQRHVLRVYETIEGRQPIRTPRFLILRQKDSELPAECARLHASHMTGNENNIGRAVCHQLSREFDRSIMLCRCQRGV
jgi:hypothetical protein